MIRVHPTCPSNCDHPQVVTDISDAKNWDATEGVFLPRLRRNRPWEANGIPLGLPLRTRLRTRLATLARNTQKRRRYASSAFRGKFRRLGYSRTRLPLRRELKRYSNWMVTTAVSTGLHWNVGANIAQGTSDQQRIGNQIQVSGLTFQGVLYNDTAAGKGGVNSKQVMLRICIVKFKGPQPTGYFPSAGDLSDLFNPLPVHGGQVLWDRLFYLQPWSYTDANSANVAQPEQQQFKFYKKFPRGALVAWSPTGDPVQNDICIMFYTNLDTYLYIHRSIRLSYYDV